MQKKPAQIFIAAASTLAFFLLLYFVYKALTPQNTTVQKEVLKIRKSDHIKWAKKGKSVLIEYSDIQCPACKNFHKILKSFEATNSAYPDITKKVTFVYRHFPLTQIHKNSFSAALAVEAAGKQGKFFEMLDYLFETQDSWKDLSNPESFFEEAAKKINLDVEKFKQDFTSKETKEKVYSDMQSGEKLKVFATPTFFLNGKKLEFNTYQEFIEELRKASAY